MYSIEGATVHISMKCETPDLDVHVPPKPNTRVRQKCACFWLHLFDDGLSSDVHGALLSHLEKTSFVEKEWCRVRAPIHTHCSTVHMYMCTVRVRDGNGKDLDSPSPSSCSQGKVYG